MTYQEKAGMPGYSSVLLSLTVEIHDDDDFDEAFAELKQIVKDKIAERVHEQEAAKNPEGPATKRQVNYLMQLAKKRNLTMEELETQFGPVDTVSRASEIIDAMLASGA